MKVTAVSALHQAMGKVHMNVALDQVSQNRNGTQNAAATPTSTKIELGPTAAARLIKSDYVDGYLLLSPASSGSIGAQSSNINLLSEPDAVAQEMASNLRPSMSQSGEALLDITMPDNLISTSAFEVQETKDANIPLVLREMEEQLVAFYEGPNTMAQSETEYTESDKPYPIPPTKHNEPFSEISVPSVPADFLYAPNRTQELPPSITPDDIPYTEIPKRVAELKPQADKLGVLATLQQQQALQAIDEARTPSKPAETEVPDRVQPVAFDIPELEIQQQSTVLKSSADELESQTSKQALDALMHQFNLSIT